MKKVTKIVAAAALAGVMCLSVGAFAACDSGTKEGKSAYEIAVDNGFTGTEAEWLESLKVSEPTTVTKTDVSYDVNADGKTVVTITLTMSDGSTQTQEIVLPKRIVSASLDNGSFIWTADEAKNKSNLAGAVWRVKYDDGSEGAIPATASQIVNVLSYEQYAERYGNPPAWDGAFKEGEVYVYTFAFAKHWHDTAGAFVYVCNDPSTLEVEPDDRYVDCAVDALQVNETFDLNTAYWTQSYDLGDILSEKYNGSYYGNHYFELCKAVTATMLDKTPDTSTVGEKYYTVTDGQERSGFYFEVYDPSVTTVESMWFTGEDSPSSHITLTQGDRLDTSVYVGKKMEVRYYIATNGTKEEKITVTAAMIDASDVDTSTPGHYKIKIGYKGYTEEIEVTVNPDMTSATKERTLNGNGMTIFALMMGAPVTAIDLYDNGFADVYIYESGENVSLASQLGYLAYTLSDGVLEVAYDGEKVAIFKADTAANAFTDYEFAAGDLVKTYTGAIPEMGAVTVKTYSNGYGQLIMGEGNQAVTIVIGYKVEGDTLKLMPTAANAAFEIGEGDTITIIM